LIPALNDNNQEVRSAAALALGQMGEDKSVEPLARMLQSRSLRDRRGAIIALGTIGGAKACDVLTPVRTENSILAMRGPFSDDAAPISSSN
jgi:HEAT repeat protein